ncbi:hypothetical protein [Photobacterium sp. 1_MG-2023]|uniref:hypothetical protein n=1 Tax=Photobacterium sp. 1_MG-2023 TaxID=3062646 RepID=UPI0026E315E8|nr:hypothetical protein [Photobacterium sp. 1_MG-2023]MDO6707202.1 hypothetical protein [Photobacterium sp. 1_MG-2023]
MSEIRTDELIIQGDWSPQAGATVVFVRSLIMKAGSRILIDGQLQEFSLFCEESRVEENTRFEGRGNGAGDDGVNLVIYLGKTEIKGLTVDTTGEKGETGAKGSRGRNGGNATCTGSGATNGGPGGKGAQGGAGGRGGNVILGIDASSLPLQYLEIITQGGPGGDGGDGGDGGRGGAGKRCGLWKRGAGRSGPRGASGDPGPEGIDGEVNVLKARDMDHFLEMINR